MVAIFTVIGKRLLTRGRMIGLGVMAVVTIGLGLLVGQAEGATDSSIADFINVLGLTLLVPVVCLVFASAALGDLYENGSLVYLWLRPLARWQIAAAATAAAIAVCLPVLAITLGLTGAVGGSGRVGLAALVATAFAVPAYCGLFTALGLVSRQGLIWGLGYILFFEGFVGILGQFASRLAVVSYSRSILAKLGDVPINLATTPVVVAIIVLAGITAGAIGLTSWRLSSMNVP